MAAGVRGGPMPAGYAYEWNRFTDWCAAVDATSMPAHPVTVAEFLDDHPAPPATQRRRLAAVTAAHTAAGHPSPARASVIRALLHPATTDPADTGTTAARDGLVTDVIRHLPSVGWPHGLFGRRDALLLVLTHHAHLGPTAAVRLHRADVTTTTTDRELAVTTGPFDRVVLPPTDDSRTCPACVHRRWAQVLASTDADPPAGPSGRPCTPPPDPARTAPTRAPARSPRRRVRSGVIRCSPRSTAGAGSPGKAPASPPATPPTSSRPTSPAHPPPTAPSRSRSPPATTR